MADELRLDIIVDDHGGAQKLAEVDAGVKKVTGSAAASAASVGDLSASFRVAALSVMRFLGFTGGFAAITAAIADVANEASRLNDVAARLDVSASKFQRVSNAASEFGVSSEQLASAIGRLQARIGSGKIDEDLTRIGISLDAIRAADGVAQLEMVAAAIGQIEDPSLRAAEATATLGRDGEAMRGILTKAFADSAAAADAMSDRTIQRLDEMGEAFARLKTKGRNMLGELTVAMADFLTFQDPENELGPLPNVRGPSGTRPDSLPIPGRVTDDMLLKQEIQEDNLRIANEMEAAVRGSLEASMQMVKIWGSEMPEAITFVSPVLEQIAEGQRIITADAEKWAETLEERVNGTLRRTVGLIDQAIVKNTMLMGGAQQERDRLMQQLTATTNPNESEYDKRFNEIDQEAKRKLALVDQTDRETAAQAENAILEEMNLKVLELQQHWEGVNQQKTAALEKSTALRTSYDAMTASLNPGGQQLPNGLTAPTAQQVASGRYFGPVTPNGDPDLARLGGAVPGGVTHHNTFNMQGSVFDSLDQLALKVDTILAERERNQGTRTRR